jgi:hypothetical protein
MIDERKIRILIEEMVRLLITYEIELTTYQTVYDAVQGRLRDAGIDVDLHKMLKHVSDSASLHAEAEAEYAAFFGVIRKLTPEAVDGALDSIRGTIDQRNSRTK